MRRSAAWLVALAGVEVWLIAELFVEPPDMRQAVRRVPSFVANPTRVVFEHDGIATTGYALYVRHEDGAEWRLELGLVRPDERGIRSASLPGLPIGQYSLEIVAYNAAGESPRVRAEPSRFIVTMSRRPGERLHRVQAGR